MNPWDIEVFCGLLRLESDRVGGIAMELVPVAACAGSGFAVWMLGFWAEPSIRPHGRTALSSAIQSLHLMRQQPNESTWPVSPPIPGMGDEAPNRSDGSPVFERMMAGRSRFMTFSKNH
jgi:hypothetical protein